MNTGLGAEKRGRLGRNSYHLIVGREFVFALVLIFDFVLRCVQTLTIEPTESFPIEEAGYVIVRLAQKFGDIKTGDERIWKEKLELTLSSLNGVLAGLKATKVKS
jgi:hypothetical protein